MEQSFISLANSVRAEVLYDMSFSIDIDEFYKNYFYSKLADQKRLYFNLNTNHIHNVPL